jgi:integrase
MPNGIIPVQGRACIRAHGRGASCRCPRSYEAWTWNKREGRKERKTFSGTGAFTEAKAWRDGKKAELAQAKRAPAQPTGLPTIREAAETFIADAEAGKPLKKGFLAFKPSTVRGYARDLRERVVPDFGPMRLDELTRKDVKALVERLVASGLSGQTVRNVVVALQSLYSRYEDDVAYPAHGIDLPSPGARREHWAKAKDATELLAALPESDRAVWATALFAGLRLGELRALRVSDIDLQANTIAVAHGWDVKAGQIEPKSKAGRRIIPVAGTLAELLRAHFERTGRSGQDLIFGRTRLAPFTDSHLRKRSREAWAAAAIGMFLRGESGRLEPLGFQEARHSFRSYLSHIPAIDPVRAKSYQGHSDESVTARYTHWSEEELERDARALDAYITGRASGQVVELAEATAR